MNSALRIDHLLPDGSFLTLTDVQYVPSCDRNLISISKATLHGALFRFLHDAVHESRLGFKVATLVGPEYDRLYKFLLSPFSESKPSASSVSSFFSAPGVLATLELPDTAMDVDQVDLDTLMTESTPMSMLGTSVHELSPAHNGLNSDETAVVPSLDIEMSDPDTPSLELFKQIAHLDNQSSSNAITDCPSESCRQINVALSESSSPVSSPAVVEPSSPPVVSKTNPRSLIEYISDSEASLSGEDYKISYYEHHHDNFDFSDDKDYVENPVRKRKASTEKLRRRSEV